VGEEGGERRRLQKTTGKKFKNNRRVKKKKTRQTEMAQDKGFNRGWEWATPTKNIRNVDEFYAKPTRKKRGKKKAIKSGPRSK